MASNGRSLRIGIQLPEVERVVRWPEYLAMARAAEDVGFDTLWLGDHPPYPYQDGSTRGPWAARTMPSALAPCPPRLRAPPPRAGTRRHAPPLLPHLPATADAH